jgi:RelB Antitoxin alpha helical domain
MEPAEAYPFAQELITDAQGHVRKVILDIAAYQALLTALEDEGLYRAMQAVRDETPLSLSAALSALEEP